MSSSSPSEPFRHLVAFLDSFDVVAQAHAETLKKSLKDSRAVYDALYDRHDACLYQNRELAKELETLRGQKKKDDLALISLREQLAEANCDRKDLAAVAEQRRLKINELETKLVKLEQMAANAKQTPAAAAPAPVYRELVEREIIQEGDEFCDITGKYWLPFELFVGAPADRFLSKTRTTRPAPAPAPVYRQLIKGEVIQEGDEYLSSAFEYRSSSTIWIPISGLTGRVFDGISADLTRTTRPAPAPAPVYRQLVVGEIIEKGDELLYDGIWVPYVSYVGRNFSGSCSKNTRTKRPAPAANV